MDQDIWTLTDLIGFIYRTAYVIISLYLKGIKNGYNMYFDVLLDGHLKETTKVRQYIITMYVFISR